MKSATALELLPSANPSLMAARQAWASVIGQQHVVSDQPALSAAATATFQTGRTIPLILRPGSVVEVQECMRIANHFRVPVYPVSSGMNWGYGSKVPSSNGCALMELARMNAITDFNEDLGYVTVEPGVTQRQLFEFLRDRKSRLWMDATGASPDSSLLGNTMERGFGHTPYGDHFKHVSGFEVVMPQGDLVKTGFSRFEGASAAPVYPWGVGPYLDGLFTQSNFGIVTRMTLWLMPRPQYFQAFFFRCDDPAALAPLIEAVRPLRMDGTLRSTIHIGNDYKVLSGLQQFPFDETGGEMPLSQDRMAGFRTNLQFGAWNGSGGLYGTRAQVAEARRLIRKALKGKVNKLQFLDDRMLRIAGKFSKPLSWLTRWDLSRALELVKPIYGLMKGIPTDHPLQSAYWRKRSPVPQTKNPDRDGCGLLWCAPVAPATGAHAKRMSAIVIDTLLSHGFEPMISITLITERALTCVATISYDRHVPGEDEKARACLRDLLDKLSAAGYYSYRLGIQSMEEMTGSNGYNDFLRTLKAAIDPNAILAPGRYEASRQKSAAAGQAG